MNVDISDFIVDLAYFITGMSFARWRIKRADKKDQPNRWACLEKGCGFTIKSNDVSVTLRIADYHEEWHRFKKRE